MGQKVNPVLFRLSTSSVPNISCWYTNNKESYSQLIHQDLELRNFLLNALRSRGVLARSCIIQRSSNKLMVSLDLFFSYILAKQAKFLWARSLFKAVKKKYTKINRIRDVKNFVHTLGSNTLLHNSKSSVVGKKYINSRKKTFFSVKLKTLDKNIFLSYKNRLFFFLVLKKHKLMYKKKKEDNKLLSTIRNSSKGYFSNRRFVRLNLHKFSRLFVLQKFNYNFRSYSVKKSVPTALYKSDSLDLLELNKNLCRSIKDFCGVEEIQLSFFSNQLNYMSSFKFFHKSISKELVRFQKDRDLKKYFVETVETLYFIVRTFGFGNAYLLGQVLVFLLENNRRQISVAKFFKKALNVLFQTVPMTHLAVDGIKILIKGRFNKRRRTKKVVLQEGQISLQTIATPIDYCQTQAVTIYGTFGIKIWISKR